jgi:hypothetical protein
MSREFADRARADRNGGSAIRRGREKPKPLAAAREQQMPEARATTGLVIGRLARNALPSCGDRNPPTRATEVKRRWNRKS